MTKQTTTKKTSPARNKPLKTKRKITPISTRGSKNTSHIKPKPFQRKKPIKRIQPDKKLPDLSSENIRIIPLGGVEEVGKNMTLIEYKDNILVFDAGVQFTSEEEAPGVDYIIPNTKYLEERKGKIKGLIVTHGHLDHIGGIPYIIEKIGNPTIYSSELTSIMIQKKMEDFPTHPPLNFKNVEPGEKMKIGELKVKFFPVTHSIPGALGTSIETPHGNIIVTGDIKLEHDDGIPSEKEAKTWEELSKDNNLLLIADSTNVEKPGFSMPEKVVYDNIEQIIKNTKGRLIIGTFASQFERMIKIIQIAEKYGKKIVTEGRSIKVNIEIAKIIKLFEPKKGTVISAKEIENYPPDRIVVLATGSQGEEFAALMRMAIKQHKHIFLNERDTVVLSSSVIPGNEISVRRLEDNLYRHNLKVIHYRTSDVHSTGHGNAQELAWINQKVGAKFFMPSYGHHSMLKVHAEIVKSLGFPSENIVIPDDGSIIEIQNTGKKITILKEKAPSGIAMVDGFSIGNIQEVVIRDRQTLAQDGIFVVIAMVDLGKGKLKKSPDIISRGFIYLRESQDLLKQARYITKQTIEKMAKGAKPIDFDIIKKEVTDNVGRYLFQSTNKRPVVIPVILRA
ncbi:MAG: ribonuclease J [Patescibacteria group bacterium]|nr:ribonuclease J [Patescibacteria group bacterium]